MKQHYCNGKWVAGTSEECQNYTAHGTKLSRLTKVKGANAVR